LAVTTHLLFSTNHLRVGLTQRLLVLILTSQLKVTEATSRTILQIEFSPYKHRHLPSDCLLRTRPPLSGTDANRPVETRRAITSSSAYSNIFSSPPAKHVTLGPFIPIAAPAFSTLSIITLRLPAPGPSLFEHRLLRLGQRLGGL
jgi:hypothetical protein